jgi:hypothetical protein
MGPRTGLEDVEWKKYLTHAVTRTLNSSAFRSVAGRNTDYAIPALQNLGYFYKSAVVDLHI